MRRRPSGSGEDEDASAPLRSVDPSVETTSSPRRDSIGSRSDSSRSSSHREMTATKPAVTRTPRFSRKSSTSARRSPILPPTSAAVTSWSSANGAGSLDKDLLGNNGSNKQTNTEEKARWRHEAHVRGPWRCSLLTLLVCLCSVALLFGVVKSFLTRQLDSVGCAMSYMRPIFTHFSDFDTEHTRFASKYSLYLYREYGVDEDTRVKGVPVLFVPGNAGSYKQVRPIAAEAANYFQETLRESASAIASGKRALDFFTVDFNEELTAFSGQTLLDQAEYLNEAVAYILALYHSPSRSAREPGLPDPKSVIIVGHSMGGVVARTMLHMPNYQERSINTIFTLSAPHARAPISFDAELVAVYEDVNTFWRRSFLDSETDGPLADMTLVSAAGGGLDTTIASEYSSLTSLVPDTHGFTVFTSSIPRVWTGMDHLAIMWCDQFRKALVRAIFDSIDARRSSQTIDQPERIAALRRRLLTGMEPVVRKLAPNMESATFLNLKPELTSVLSIGERLSLDGFGGDGAKAHLLPIISQGKDDIFTLMTDQPLDANTDVATATVAVFLCSSSPPLPEASLNSFDSNVDIFGTVADLNGLACKNAAADASLLPASTSDSREAFANLEPFTYLQYHLSDLVDYQYVAIVDMAAEEEPGWLRAEFSESEKSAILVSKGHHQLLIDGLHVTLPADRPMMTELKIPEVHSTMFAYTFEIDRHQCNGSGESFAPLLRQYIQEPYESKYFVNVRRGNINIHGISPYMPPPLSGGGASEGLSLQLWTDPNCNSPVEVTLKVDVLGSAGKLVMRYRAVFAAFPLLVVAIVLRKQFKVYDASGVFISFSQSLDQCLRTSLPTIFAALTFLAIALAKASQTPWAAVWIGVPMAPANSVVDFTVNDVMLGTSDPFFWFLVPLFGLVSVGICVVFNYATLVITHTFTLMWSFVWRAPSGFITSATSIRLLTLGICVMLISTLIPYQFAYVALVMVHILTCVRALRISRETKTLSNDNFSNYTHSMLLLFFFILPINLPTLVVWMRNLAARWLTPFSTYDNLSAILPYILLVETMSTGHMLPRVTSNLRYFTNSFIFVLALYAAVFGVTYAYRLHHLVNALCAWLFLLHYSNRQPSPARLLTAARNTKKRP